MSLGLNNSAVDYRLSNSLLLFVAAVALFQISRRKIKCPKLSVIVKIKVCALVVFVGVYAVF